MAAAPSPPQRTAKPRVTLPYPLLPAPKTTTSGEDADDDIERFLRPRTDENMCIKKGSKRTRWTALRLESKGSAEGVYDDLWGTLGKEGKRWLSVAKHGGVLWALLYKGDDGEVDMTNLSPKATPYDVQEVTSGGPASRKALAEFARAWLGNAQEATSNFTVQTEEEQQAEALEAFVGLIDDLPQSPERFAEARDAQINSIRTSRLGFRQLLGAVRMWELQGVTIDPRAWRFEKIQQAELAHVLEFHGDHVGGRPKLVTVVGDLSKMDLAVLEELGAVRRVEIEEIFGY